MAVQIIPLHGRREQRRERRLLVAIQDRTVGEAGGDLVPHSCAYQ